MSTVSVGGGVFISNPVFGTVGVALPGLPEITQLGIPDGLGAAGFSGITGNLLGTPLAIGGGAIGPADFLQIGVQNTLNVLAAVNPNEPALQVSVGAANTTIINQVLSPDALTSGSGPITLGLDTAGPVSVASIGITSVASAFLAANSSPALQVGVNTSSGPLGAYIAPSSGALQVAVPGVETVSLAGGIVSLSGLIGSLPSLPSLPSVDSISSGSGLDTVVPAGASTIPGLNAVSGLVSSAIDTLIGGAASVPSALGSGSALLSGADSLSSVLPSDFAPLSGIAQAVTPVLSDVTSALGHLSGSSPLVSMDGGLTNLLLKNL